VTAARSLLDTAFTRQVGVELPIIGGAMYPCSNPELVGAVSAGGGIGVVQPVSLTYVHGHDYREGLRLISTIAAGRPIGMNALIEQGSRHYHERMVRFVETSLEEGVRFFITSLGNPRWVVDRVTPAGGIVYHDVTERKWALKGLDGGVHGLICVNSRAGGHAGGQTPQQMLDELGDLGVPLVCAGGIGEADEFVAALRMGYAAVQLGTRFIASTECTAHEHYKQGIVDAEEKDVVLTERLTGIPVAVLNTPYVQRLGLRANRLSRWLLRNRRTKHFMRTWYMLRSFFALKRSAKRGDEHRDYWQAGKSVATIRSIEPVATIMSRFAQAARAVAALLLIVFGTALGAQARPTMALVGGRVLDGYGGPPIENGVVLIAGERIVAVGREADVRVPAGIPIVDTNGMTVMPGLIDMHVHLQILGHGDYKRWNDLYGTQNAKLVMPIAAKQLLMAGVTSARDLGGPPRDILDVKRRIAGGEIPGPRLFVSGPFIQHAPYEEYEKDFRWGVNGADDARAKVEQVVQMGADVIKLIDQDQMTLEEVRAVVETAHRLGKPVVAHAHRMEEIRRGLRFGVDDFEHTGLGTAPGYPEDILQGMRERNSSLYWTPTISPLYTMYAAGQSFGERLDDPAWRDGMPKDMADEIRRSLSDIPHLPYYALFPSRIPLLPHKFQQLKASGVRLLIGTDAGIPTNFHNDATWREMVKWVELGVSPMETIQSATLWPARALRAEDRIGVLAEGRFADVIAVRGDPLSDMTVMRDVKVIVQGGKRIK
jgi:NAD(P)H-dependent flavin oxidoreductase YrpB (nitropropane dioxygenase family)/imidazolonepropionase-like amidohydrolase